jgi:hypothetical protein
MTTAELRSDLWVKLAATTEQQRSWLFSRHRWVSQVKIGMKDMTYLITMHRKVSKRDVL